MPSKRKRKRRKNKLTPLLVKIPLVWQNNYTQQILMMIILAECYMRYLEYCKKRSDSIKTQSPTTKPPIIHQNASFSDAKVDPKLTHDSGFPEDYYGFRLAYCYDNLVKKAENELSYNIKANQNNVGSNFQVPIQVGSFCFVP